MANAVVKQLKDKDGKKLMPVTLDSAVMCTDDSGNQTTIKAYINSKISGGSGGGGGSSLPSVTGHSQGSVLGLNASLGLTWMDPITSENVPYNNASSGLTATKVKGAIDEVNTKANGSINGLSVSQTATGVTVTPSKTGGGNATAINIGVASSTQAGLMTPTQVKQLSEISIPYNTWEGYTEAQQTEKLEQYTNVYIISEE